MPALKDTVFFKELTTRESDNAKIYAGKLLEISDDVGRFLEFIKTNFPDYPDHGIQHSYRILNYVARVVDKQIGELSDTEIFCFVLAALFHDTGMSLVGFASKNSLRAKHPINASVAIDKYFNEALPRLKSEARINTVVKYVCKAHGLDIDVMYNDQEFHAVDTINGDNVRNSVLSVFLRIGDLLDLDEERTNWLALKLFPEVFSEEATAHNIRHLNVQKYRCDSESLNIVVKVHNITEYKIWNEWLGFLDKDILYANTYLKKEKISFPALSKSIKKDDNADFDVEEIRFELDDKGGIWEILSQSIYTNEFDFVREVIQNAIDATLFDTYLKDSIPIEHPSPRSWKLSRRATPVFACYSADKRLLYVIDNGIGMNDSDLKRFLFKVSGTGYRDANKRIFSFPSIAKYGIGFVSCLINAEKIEIYTAKESSEHIQKVTLETGINHAFIEKIPSDGYIGTTLSLELKHQYSFDEIHDYIRETFKYPSVEICCINIDTLSVNAERLDDTNTPYCTGKPYKLIDCIERIQQTKERITRPVRDELLNLRNIKYAAESLVSWIRNNREYNEKFSDKEKFADFKEKIRKLMNSILYSDVKKQFPFTLTGISEKGLFTQTDEYVDKVNTFIEYLKNSIAYNDEKLKRYPPFYHAVPKYSVTFEGDWEYLVADFNEFFQINNVKQYKEPIDLGHRTGLILIKHTYQNYDEGIEYAAINGFLFNEGCVATRLVQIKGYHNVLHGDEREKRFIIGTYDSFRDIDDALKDNCLNVLENNDDEAYLIDVGNGDYALGLSFEPMLNVVSIINNEIVSSMDVDKNIKMEAISSQKQNNIIANLRPINFGSFSEGMDDLRKIDVEKSVYCQDGIVIPFEIEDLFPIGYTKLICNTTYKGRMPLNVTRHETSRIRSEVDSWYNNVGRKIQKQIYQHISKVLESVNLDFDISEMVDNCWPQDYENIFGMKSKLTLRKLGDN